MSRKIILVDDQPMFRRSLKMVLTSIGDVDIIGEAANGEEFLELMETKKPDAVFMDIEMPVMNGIEATKEAIKIYPHLIIIGLSLYENESYINKLISAGARGYLIKSKDNFEIFKTIIEHPKADIFFSENLKYKPNVEKNKVKTILLIDDFETNTIVISKALKNAGFNVFSANSVKDALGIIKEKTSDLDLIVTDYEMQDMNGSDLIMKIRDNLTTKRIPPLVLSGTIDKEKKLAAKEASATGWIRKPFVINKFIKIIEKALK